MQKEIKNMTLAERMFSIMSEVRPLEKTERNDVSGYTYVPEASVKDYIRGLLVKYRVLLTYDIIEGNDVNGKSVVTLRYVFLNIDNTDEEVTGTWIGEGFNHSGYAVATAITSAVKQHLMTQFLIPSYDDPERVNGTSTKNLTSTEKPMEERMPLEDKEPEIPPRRRRPSDAVKGIEDKIPK